MSVGLLAPLGLAALAAASWLPPASAGTFTISPLRVDLSQATPAAALTVRNEESAAIAASVAAPRSTGKRR